MAIWKKNYIVKQLSWYLKRVRKIKLTFDKALYGLKQAPRAWNTKIDYFKKHGFVKSLTSNLYISRKNKWRHNNCMPLWG